MSVTNLDEYRRQREVDEEIEKLRDDVWNGNGYLAWWRYLKNGLCDKPEPPESAA